MCFWGRLKYGVDWFIGLRKEIWLWIFWLPSRIFRWESSRNFGFSCNFRWIFEWELVGKDTRCCRMLHEKTAFPTVYCRYRWPKQWTWAWLMLYFHQYQTGNNVVSDVSLFKFYFVKIYSHFINTLPSNLTSELFHVKLIWFLYESLHFQSNVLNHSCIICLLLSSVRIGLSLVFK